MAQFEVFAPFQLFLMEQLIKLTHKYPIMAQLSQSRHDWKGIPIRCLKRSAYWN